MRFIVGTNADLERATQEGRFLLNLYYRINVLPVRLPTLAERRDEIARWARFMVKRCVSEVSAGVAAVLAEDAEQSLEAYTWPGNLRQLDNVVRRALMLALAELADERATHATVTRAHVEAALVMEHSGKPSAESNSAIDTLRASARALVEGIAANDGDAAAEIFDLAATRSAAWCSSRQWLNSPTRKRPSKRSGRRRRSNPATISGCSGWRANTSRRCRRA